MRIDADQLFSGAQSILLAAGVDKAQAQTVTENLIWCDMVARRNHGVERLPILLDHVAAGTIKCPSTPNFQDLGPVMQRMDADQSFGHHAARLATDRACDLAEQQGVGIVGVMNSSFFGAGAYYANLAAERNMISLVLSNSFPKVAAPGGLRAALGTNPFAFGAPRANGRSILVDMSTAAVAGSTVREKADKGEHFTESVAIDKTGEPIFDPELVLGGTLLPAAGAKGYGIALLVEILSATLTGAAMSHQVASMYKNFERNGENGHFFMAIDVSRWMPIEQFYERLEILADTIYASGSDNSTRLAGEQRWQKYDESLSLGVELESKTQSALADLADRFSVVLPWTQDKI